MQAAFVKVVTPLDAAVRIDRTGRSREHPEPAPGTADLRVLHFERVRHFDAAALSAPIRLPQSASRQHLQAQLRGERARQHHHPVLAALGFAHDDGVAVEIHVLDAKAQRFHQPHAGAIQKPGEQRRLSLKRGQNPGDLVLGQHRRNAFGAPGPLDSFHPRQFDVQNLPV